MTNIMDLRAKRAALWEQTKDFLEAHRGENGMVEASAVEQYEKMAADVKALGDEIKRLEDQAEMDAVLSAPTSKAVQMNPAGRKDKVKPTATDEYNDAFWNMMRGNGHLMEVRNELSVGENDEGGYTVPDEFERRLVQGLEENNIFRQIAHVIRTSSGTRKIPIANDTMEASWVDEGEAIPETSTKFAQTTLSAYKMGAVVKVSNSTLLPISLSASARLWESQKRRRSLSVPATSSPQVSSTQLSVLSSALLQTPRLRSLLMTSLSCTTA